jgi:hypothetical protein
MGLHYPTDEFLKAAGARARRREQEKRRQSNPRKRFFHWTLLLLALLLLTGLLVDIWKISRRMDDFQRAGVITPKGDAADIAAGLTGARYVDPAGLFSLVPPRNWVPIPDLNSFFNVIFQGPYGMDLRIQVVATNGLTFDKLIEDLKRVERNLSADTHMDFAYVGPYRAVKRSVQLFKSKVLILDFVTGDLEHHVQFSMPPKLYDEYEPVFLRLMQTYEPGSILPAQEAPAAP